MHRTLLPPLLLLLLAIAAPAVEGTTREWLWSGGQWRSFLLHVPRAYSPLRATPLVVNFHAYTSTAETAEAMTGFSALAEREGFIVAYPEALPHAEADGKPTWLSAATGELLDGNEQYVRDVVANLRWRLAVDARRIYATGMSQGGGMSLYCGARMSEIFAAIAPVVVSLPRSFDFPSSMPDRPMPVLLQNGTEDRIVPYHGGPGSLKPTTDFLPTTELIARFVAHNQCSPWPLTWNVPNWNWFDGCTATVTHHGWGAQGSEVVLYTVNGGGHTWPMSRVWLPWFIFGSTCQDYDGSQVIWDFFKRHAMPLGVN